ncbi:Hypothetical predicted protein [Podarcis lilfordi]|uniref:Uncharacterized protein n=1 Tax=Podarcis lilfordi TaxID=74358 RepID=A0AA35NZE0_9SAUR|nr:Hypothetical predicted protein [Podarcis lilfordi]
MEELLEQCTGSARKCEKEWDMSSSKPYIPLTGLSGHSMQNQDSGPLFMKLEVGPQALSQKLASLECSGQENWNLVSSEQQFHIDVKGAWVAESMWYIKAAAAFSESYPVQASDVFPG